MAKSQNETGDYVNLVNFRRVQDFCIGFGPRYNPSNPLIKLANLDTVATAQETAYDDYIGLKTPTRAAIADREIVFSPVSKRMTRVSNEVKASAIDEETMLNIVNLIKKINGIRIDPKLKQPENTPPEDIIKYISASQMGFDNRIGHITELISMLAGEAGYAPSEADLKVAALQTMLDDLKLKNLAVSNKYSLMVIARNTFNNIMYRESDGSCDTIGQVKAYIKAVFGGNSPEFHEVAKIKFRKKKI